MNFYQKKRRTPVLQIISMIDILIILLIFLVVSTTFKDPRKVKTSSNSAARSVLNVSIPVSDTMVLGTDTASRVSLTVTKDEKCFLDKVEIPLPQLVESLKLFRSKSSAKLDLVMDEKVPFGTTIKIWDAVKKAGYESGEAPTRVNRPSTSN